MKAMTFKPLYSDNNICCNDEVYSKVISTAVNRLRIYFTISISAVVMSMLGYHKIPCRDWVLWRYPLFGVPHWRWHHHSDNEDIDESFLCP